MLEHAWGRPRETVEVHEDLTGKDPDEMGMIELLQALREGVGEHGFPANSHCRSRHGIARPEGLPVLEVEDAASAGAGE